MPRIGPLGWQYTCVRDGKQTGQIELPPREVERGQKEDQTLCRVSRWRQMRFDAFMGDVMSICFLYAGRDMMVVVANEGRGAGKSKETRCV